MRCWCFLIKEHSTLSLSLSVVVYPYKGKPSHPPSSVRLSCGTALHSYCTASISLSSIHIHSSLILSSSLEMLCWFGGSEKWREKKGGSKWRIRIFISDSRAFLCPKSQIDTLHCLALPLDQVDSGTASSFYVLVFTVHTCHYITLQYILQRLFILLPLLFSFHYLLT